MHKIKVYKIALYISYKFTKSKIFDAVRVCFATEQRALIKKFYLAPKFNAKIKYFRPVSVLFMPKGFRY